jgi:hypothetical protein
LLAIAVFVNSSAPDGIKFALAPNICAACPVYAVIRFEMLGFFHLFS